MIGAALLLVIHMFISFIYTELVFKMISYDARNKKINTQKTIYEIIIDILAKENLHEKIKIDISPERNTDKSYYCECGVILLSREEGTAGATAAAIHECGHAIQYNKSQTALKIIRIRDALKKFRFLDVVSPLAVPFFAAFCTPLYIIFCAFLVKLVVRVIIEFWVEADANLRVLKYIKEHIPYAQDRIAVTKYLAACLLTYLSTIN